MPRLNWPPHLRVHTFTCRSWLSLESLPWQDHLRKNLLKSGQVADHRHQRASSRTQATERLALVRILLAQAHMQSSAFVTRTMDCVFVHVQHDNRFVCQLLVQQPSQPTNPNASLHQDSKHLSACSGEWNNPRTYVKHAMLDLQCHDHIAYVTYA